jgi:hypothetical protein
MSSEVTIVMRPSTTSQLAHWIRGVLATLPPGLEVRALMGSHPEK